MSVDTLLERDAFWQPDFANRSARGNPAEKGRRLRALMKANWAVGQGARGFVFSSSVSRSAPLLPTSCRVNLDRPSP